MSIKRACQAADQKLGAAGDARQDAQGGAKRRLFRPSGAHTPLGSRQDFVKE